MFCVKLVTDYKYLIVIKKKIFQGNLVSPNFNLSNIISSIAIDTISVYAHTNKQHDLGYNVIFLNRQLYKSCICKHFHKASL